jgi:hypothetical protein
MRQSCQRDQTSVQPAAALYYCARLFSRVHFCGNCSVACAEVSNDELGVTYLYWIEDPGFDS